jgi:hypothetical protein
MYNIDTTISPNYWTKAGYLGTYAQDGEKVSDGWNIGGDCSESAMGLYNGSRSNYSIMRIPLALFFEKDFLRKKEKGIEVTKINTRIDDIENNLKEWVRFGRKLGITLYYDGIENPNDYPVGQGFYCWKNSRGPFNYNSKVDELSLKVKYFRKDVINEKDALGHFAFARYFYAKHNFQTYIKAIEIFNLMPEWDEIKSFYMAHNFGGKQYDGYYGLLATNLIQDSRQTLRNLNTTRDTYPRCLNAQWDNSHEDRLFECDDDHSLDESCGKEQDWLDLDKHFKLENNFGSYSDVRSAAIKVRESLFKKFNESSEEYKIKLLKDVDSYLIKKFDK